MNEQKDNYLNEQAAVRAKNAMHSPTSCGWDLLDLSDKIHWCFHVSAKRSAVNRNWADGGTQVLSI